ncbi:hypothetical protein [Micromonospora sp. NPDC050276]|uniref:ATP-dependent DNA ligase n=1 Tax=Micromonospora sp. NPDC050276 TaxID=3364278 RepID=UPI0037ABDFE9
MTRGVVPDLAADGPVPADHAVTSEDLEAAAPAVPVGAVLDGELIVFERGRTNVAPLQRCVTAGRGLLRLARECPAHYVLFDLLADAGGEVLLHLSLSERRARLERASPTALRSATPRPRGPDGATPSPPARTGWTSTRS